MYILKENLKILHRIEKNNEKLNFYELMNNNPS